MGTTALVEAANSAAPACERGHRSATHFETDAKPTEIPPGAFQRTANKTLGAANSKPSLSPWGHGGPTEREYHMYQAERRSELPGRVNDNSTFRLASVILAG